MWIGPLHCITAKCQMDLINHRPNQWPKVESGHVDWTTALHHCKMPNGQPSLGEAGIYREPNPRKPTPDFNQSERTHPEKWWVFQPMTAQQTTHAKSAWI